MVAVSVLSSGPGQTALIARAIAPYLHVGDAILLEGGLATGKTTFVQAMAAALGSYEVATSPTFALAHIYKTASGSLLHIDAYRLSGVHEFRDLGLDEYIEESITMVEWGSIVAKDFASYLSIAFRLKSDMPIDQRAVEIQPVGPDWLSRIDDLSEAISAAMTSSAGEQR